MARGGNITSYDAPRDVIRPDEKGFAAFEQEGRRVGAIYRETAQDYRAIGALQAQSIEGRKWPFDILALQQRSNDVSIRFGNDRGSRSRGRAAHDDLGKMAAGMAALGGYLGATAGNSAGGELIDASGGKTYEGRTAHPGTGPGLISPMANPSDNPAYQANPYNSGTDLPADQSSRGWGGTNSEGLDPATSPDAMSGYPMPGSGTYGRALPDAYGRVAPVTMNAPAAIDPASQVLRSNTGDSGSGFWGNLWENLTSGPDQQTDSSDY